jgi:hypothetical protein
MNISFSLNSIKTASHLDGGALLQWRRGEPKRSPEGELEKLIRQKSQRDDGPED